jgi:hypothetical protein
VIRRGAGTTSTRPLSITHAPPADGSRPHRTHAFLRGGDERVASRRIARQRKHVDQHLADAVALAGQPDVRTVRVGARESALQDVLVQPHPGRAPCAAAAPFPNPHGAASCASSMIARGSYPQARRWPDQHQPSQADSPA